MRLTHQNLTSHTILHSKFNFNNVQNYLNSQQNLETNQRNSGQDLIPEHSKDNEETQTRHKKTQETKKKETRNCPQDGPRATKLSGFDNWSSSSSIPLKARVPKSNQSITNEKVENQTKENGKGKNQVKKGNGEKIKVRIETTKPKSKRKREEEEMVLKETKDSIVNREKILNERKEARRKKAAIVQDQSIPIHERLKRDAKSKVDPETLNPKRRSTTLNAAIEGLESIPKSKTIKHQGRITIGRSNTFGIFQKNVSSSKLKPTPRKGSGDLVFNELKFLDKKKRIRSSTKSQSPATEKNLNDKPHDQTSGSESDKVDSQKNDKTKKTRKEVASDSSVREPCAQEDLRTSISSHSDTDNQHSANSLRLRRNGRLTSCPSASLEGTSPKKARKMYDDHKQTSPVSSQHDPKSPDPPEISIHDGTALEDPLVLSRRPSGGDSNFKSTPELPLRSVPVDQMSNNTQTNNSLDRLIMACEADMPVIYDHITQDRSCHSHGSQVDCHTSLLSFEMEEAVNDPRFIRPSSLQYQQEFLDDDDDEAYYTTTELAEGLFLEDPVEYIYEEDFLCSPEIDEEFEVDRYGSRLDHHSYGPLESVDHRTYSRSNAPQALEYRGSHQKDVFDSPAVGEELDIHLYGSGPSRYALHHQADYLDHPVEPLEDFDSHLLLSQPDHPDTYEDLPETDHTFGRYEPNQDMIDQSDIYFDPSPSEDLNNQYLEMREMGIMMECERLPFRNRIGFEESRKRLKLDDDDRLKLKSRSAIEGAPPGFEWTASRA
ncbi:uncharacterized protein MELLADRAFT_118281 [Melampsora larici-populina 98AG31]|uniref:Uncharacterized protein n=1 Tax=Melampsora larici-populina (strain 98AG31 / pathotype 3-4-7) TaxID=747676 RepID=F4S749_MELLP|nr:uncharacterized protein MELLADRAFT_118281 [Melampsora larici-populina 98AG31]EGF99446.1 hypothetical protein MELLADRAFT_118281 [Melampsora larici-populina 98AG31]